MGENGAARGPGSGPVGLVGPVGPERHGNRRGLDRSWEADESRGISGMDMDGTMTSP